MVRTPFLPEAIQYAYVKPHVAVDPFCENTETKIKLRLLESLRISRSDSFWRYAGLLLDLEKPGTAFNVMMHAYQASRENEKEWAKLVERAGEKYGADVVEDYVASIKEDERSKKLARLRSFAGARDYRFFLALLLNVPDRDTLMNLVALEYKTNEPEVLAGQWIREMAAERMFVTKFEPPLLDILDLVVKHGSYEKAREEVVQNRNTPHTYAFDEGQMEKLWQVAHALPFFHPLFGQAAETTFAASVSNG